MPGLMLASITNAGNHGMFRLHVYMGIIDYPLGKVILVRLIVGLVLITRAPCIMKCPAVPALSITHLLVLTWVRALILSAILLLRHFSNFFFFFFLVIVFAMISNLLRRFSILFPHFSVASKSLHISFSIISTMFSMTMAFMGVECSYTRQI